MKRTFLFKAKNAATAIAMLLTGFMLAPSNASAITISYETAWSNSSGSDTTGPPSGSNWLKTLYLPKFDVAGKTLNSVTIDVIGTQDGYFTFKNNNAGTIGTAGNPINTLQNNTILNATLPDGNAISDFIQGVNWGKLGKNKITNLASGATFSSFAASYAGSPSKSANTNEHYSVSDVYSVLTTDYSFYTGTGNFATVLTAADNTTYSGPGNTDTIQFNNVGYWLQVTYDYDNTPVPEPSTFLLIGAGLLSIVGLRRRQKK